MDTFLMHGEGWVRCCICGAFHEEPSPDLAIDNLRSQTQEEGRDG